MRNFNLMQYTEVLYFARNRRTRRAFLTLNVIHSMAAAVVVIDVGSSSVAVGWAGDDSPITLPSVVDDAIARPPEGGRSNVSCM